MNSFLAEIKKFMCGIYNETMQRRTGEKKSQ